MFILGFIFGVILTICTNVFLSKYQIVERQPNSTTPNYQHNLPENKKEE